MELVNELYRYKEVGDEKRSFHEEGCQRYTGYDPFPVHTAHLRGDVGDPRIPSVPDCRIWPAYDEKALVRDTIEIVVQINGKVKEKN